MSDTTLRRRLLDRIGSAPTLLATGTRVVGDVVTAGALLLGGEVLGDGNVGGQLSIAAGAHWHGDVHAESAVIAGHLTGSILVADKIEIGASAVITGRVTARKVAVARGARIEGDIAVTSAEPILEFEEKRHRTAAPEPE
jgi:cytoskeletal protein CcmA (bactofilin family)